MSNEVRIKLTDQQKAKIKKTTGQEMGEIRVASIGANTAVTPHEPVAAKSLSAKNLSAKNLSAKNLSNKNLSAKNLSAKNLSAKNLSAKNV